MANKTFKELITSARQRDSYWAARAVLDFTEDLVRLMAQRNVSNAVLARKIGTSPAYVTKVLRGDTNFTVDTMVRLARALDGQLCVHVGRKEDGVRWIDVVHGRSQPRTEWTGEEVFNMTPIAVNEERWDIGNVSDTAAA
jgi:transcriptional regulator with XRE-family HTH domain